MDASICNDHARNDFLRRLRAIFRFSPRVIRALDAATGMLLAAMDGLLINISVSLCAALSILMFIYLCWALLDSDNPRGNWAH